MHATARRRSKGARTLGPGGQTRLAEAGVVCFFEKKPSGVKTKKKTQNVVFFRFSGRLARVRAGVYLDLSGCPGRLGPGERGDRDGEVERPRLPVLQFIIAAFSVHLMRNNNKDLNSNKRFNNFTNRLT